MEAGRLEVWRSQFAVGDFPEICALTGQRSETWLGFRFARRSALWWLGFDLPFPFGDLLWFAIRDRVGGRLPLTRRMRRTVLLARWIPVGLLVAPIPLWTAAAVAGLDSAASSTLFVIGVTSAVWGLIGVYVVKPLVSPRGSLQRRGGVEPDIIVLTNLHPTFVTAARRMYAGRTVQTGTPVEA